MNARILKIAKVLDSRGETKLADLIREALQYEPDWFDDLMGNNASRLLFYLVTAAMSSGTIPLGAAIYSAARRDQRMKRIISELKLEHDWDGQSEFNKEQKRAILKMIKKLPEGSQQGLIIAIKLRAEKSWWKRFTMKFHRDFGEL